jgi:type VI secretion system protein ImpG
MNIEQYFEQEYNYLQQAGQEFAAKHPGIAARLRLTERDRKDPFVERLMEGFAFLAGRIHERLDDDFPEFSHGLLEVLCPHFLRPFPACAILEAKHRPGVVTKPVHVKRGCEVKTRPGRFKVKYKVGTGSDPAGRLSEKEETTEFIFRTTQDVVIRPLALVGARIENDSRGFSTLVLQLQGDRNVPLEVQDLQRLRLYLDGARDLVLAMLQYLTRHAVRVEMKATGVPDSAFSLLPNARVEIAGLTADESAEEFALLPYPRQIFPGYGLLQEYFSFPDRFSFVDIFGLHEFRPPQESTGAELRVTFDRRWTRDQSIPRDSFRLHCTPIINLFDRPVEQIAVTLRQPEYYVIPDLDRRKSYEIYAINKVEGIFGSKGEQVEYLPLTSNRALWNNPSQSARNRFYSVRRKPVRADMAETYIRLYSEPVSPEAIAKHTLSIEATLSNGFLPAAYLGQGVVDDPSGFPSGVEVRNVNVPSDALECPLEQGYVWMLISHLSAGYFTLADVQVLKDALSLFNWSPTDNNPNKKRVEGIHSVDPPQLQNVIHNRGALSTVKLNVNIKAEEFEHGEGDEVLFGTILNRFLAQYVTMNCAFSLSLTAIEKGQRRQHVWSPRMGMISPL